MSFEKTQTNALLIKYVRELSQALVDKDNYIEKLKSESEKQKKKHQKRINKLEGAKRHRYLLMSFDPGRDFSLDKALAFGSQSQVLDYIFKEMRILANDPNEIVCALFDGNNTFSGPSRKYFLLKDGFTLNKTSTEKKDDPRLVQARKEVLALAQAKEKDRYAVTLPSKSISKVSKSKSEEENSVGETYITSKKIERPKKAHPKRGMKYSSSDEGTILRFPGVPKGSGYSLVPQSYFSEYEIIFNGNTLNTVYAKSAKKAAKLTCVRLVKTKVEKSAALSFTVVKTENDHHSFWKAWGSLRKYRLEMTDQDTSDSESSPKPKAKAKANGGKPPSEYEVRLGSDKIIRFADSVREAAEQGCLNFISEEIDEADAVEIRVMDVKSGKWWTWHIWGTRDDYSMELVEEE